MMGVVSIPVSHCKRGTIVVLVHSSEEGMAFCLLLPVTKVGGASVHIIHKKRCGLSVCKIQ